MADFFSRIFSIPSDVSSTYSSDDDGGVVYVGSNSKSNAEFWSGRTERKKKRKEKKEGDNASVTSSYGGGRVSPAGSDSILARSTLVSSTGSDDDDDSEGRDADRRALMPDGSGVSGDCRGRQRRSTSDQPRSPRRSAGGANNVSSRGALPIQQQQRPTSATMRHRPLSKMRKSSLSRDDDELNIDCFTGDLRARSSSIHKRSSSSTHRKRHQQQQAWQRSDGISQVSWLSRTFGGVGGSKRHSPGESSSGGGAFGGTPFAQSGSKRTGKTSEAMVRHYHQSRTENRDTKLNLLPSPEKKGLRKQPINVGDSIIIAQKYLEESEDMSVLTMPKELLSVMSSMIVNEDNHDGVRRGGRWDGSMIPEVSPVDIIQEAERLIPGASSFDVQEVGQRTVLENDIVKAYHSNGHVRQADEHGDCLSPRGGEISVSSVGDPAYPRIGEYARRFLGVLEERSNNHSTAQNFSRDSFGHGEEGSRTLNDRLVVRHREEEDKHGAIMPHSTGSGGKHIWPYNPTAVDSSLKASGRMPPPIDPPGTHGVPTIPTTLNSLDPPRDDRRPYDNGSNNIANRGAPQSVTSQQAGLSKLRSPTNKAVTFSLPPPTTNAEQSTPPSPPYMGHAVDYYTSLDQHPKTTTSLNCWSSSTLLPPVVELWSSVECSNWNMPGDMAGSAFKWETKKECALLGEYAPLLVSEEWIDARHKLVEETVTVKCFDTTSLLTVVDAPAPPPAAPAARQEWVNGLAARLVAIEHESNKDEGWRGVIPPRSRLTIQDSFSHKGDKNVHSGVSHSFQPDDTEYLENILNCEEDFEGIIPAVSSNDDRGVSSSSNIDEPDANVRHRSMWEVAYKPPKLTSSTLDESIKVEDDKWRSLIRERANAAIAIQRCARGMIQRERFYLYVGSAMILQPFIRKFLSRKRFRDLLKLKRSYCPKRWMRRSNMKVSV